MSKAGAVIGVMVLFIIIGVLVWSYTTSWNDAQEAFDKGCSATTASWSGIPSSFSCPAGTYLSWDPEHNPK